MKRRTPALTKQIRQLYEEAILAYSWWPMAEVVAAKVGLTKQQVMDAVYSDTAHSWRQEVRAKLEAARETRRKEREDADQGR
jgi:hypothetical protein